MSRKLERVLTEIQKTELKISEWEEHLQELHVQRKLLEDKEIIKCVRSTRLEGRELLDFLDRLRDHAAYKWNKDAESDSEEIIMEAPMEEVPEREDTGYGKEA